MVLRKVCATSCLEDPRAREPARARRRLLQAQASRVCLLETFSPRFCTSHPHFFFFFLTSRGSLVVVVETLALLLLPPPPSEKPSVAGEMTSKLAAGRARDLQTRDWWVWSSPAFRSRSHASSGVSLCRQRLGHADFFSEKIQLIWETASGPSRAQAPAHPPPAPNSASAARPSGQKLQKHRRLNVIIGLIPWKLQVKNSLGLGAACSSAAVWRE